MCFYSNGEVKLNFNDLFFVVVVLVAPVPAALVCVWCDDFGTIL